MILRPPSDAALLDMLDTIAHDACLSLDARAMLSMVVVRKCLNNFPSRVELGQLLQDPRGELGSCRILTIVRNAERAGYLARVTWPVPREGRRPLYTRICGAPNDVREAVAQAVGFAP